MHRRIFGGLMLAATLMIGAPTMALAASPAPTAPAVAAAPAAATPLTFLITGGGNNAVATITSFRVVDGVLTAVGTVTGTVVTTLGGTVIIPATAPVPFTAPVSNLAQAGSCRILGLDIGAIHLDVLGLVVDLAPVHVLIQAVPGAGNLVGNLLCAVAHLLDNPSTTLAGIVNLLNQILGAL